MLFVSGNADWIVTLFNNSVEWWFPHTNYNNMRKKTLLFKNILPAVGENSLRRSCTSS